jgi:hypothetical protein
MMDWQTIALWYGAGIPAMAFIISVTEGDFLIHPDILRTIIWPITFAVIVGQVVRAIFRAVF